MSDSPLARWCQWLRTLPPEVGDELALGVAAMLPGVPHGLGARAREGLIAHVESVARGTKREAGTVLCLGALTDLVVTAQSSPDTWDETNAMLEVLEQAAGEILEEDVGEMVARARLRTPLLLRQWKGAATSWAQLRAGELSPEAVMRWLRARRIDALRS